MLLDRGCSTPNKSWGLWVSSASVLAAHCSPSVPLQLSSLPISLPLSPSLASTPPSPPHHLHPTPPSQWLTILPPTHLTGSTHRVPHPPLPPPPHTHWEAPPPHLPPTPSPPPPPTHALTSADSTSQVMSCPWVLITAACRGAQRGGGGGVGGDCGEGKRGGGYKLFASRREAREGRMNGVQAIRVMGKGGPGGL